MSVSRIRGLVPQVLEAVEKPTVNAKDEIDRICRENSLDQRDAALLTRIALGAIRAQGMLSRVLRVFSGVGLGMVKKPIRSVIKSALYELIFLEKVPAYAVIYEAVEIAKKRGGRAAGGFANAVLRKVQGNLSFTTEPGEFHGSSNSSAPVGGGRYCRFGRDVFFDWARDPAAHLSEAHSHPLWLAERWVARFGPGTAARIMAADNEIPEPSLRENAGNPPPGGLLRYLGEEGIEAKPGTVPGMVRVRDIGKVLKLKGFTEGSFTVQDETAAAAAAMAGVRDGDFVLDVCAAPGGKTGVLAPAAGPCGLVAAMDVQFSRLLAMREGMNRLGLRTQIIAGDGTRPPFGDRAFDVVMLDVPCSNTGVLKRRPEARWRITARKIEGLAAVQEELLARCEPLARRTILYSTCSIDPRENQDVVRAFAAGRPEWAVKAERFSLPGEADGGYAARLARREPI